MFYLILLLVPCLCGAQTTPGRLPAGSTDDLAGLWGTEQVVAPMVRGPLVIDGRNPEWSASIGGYSVPVRRAGDTVAFVLPGGAGEFRGMKLARGSTAIRGHSIQPGTYGPYGRRYASPVELEESGREIFSGTVVPLEPVISFYVSISRSDDGTLAAFIRNPEANFFAGRSYGVTLAGDSVFLTHPEFPETGWYDRSSDRLFIPLLFNYPPLIFTRRDSSSAPGFYPRAAGAAGPYRYQPPIYREDGWRTGTLQDASIDVGAIETFVGMIIDAVPSPDNPLNIQSLLIARHGELVLEEYFYGFHRDRTHDMRSASKTIAPMLVGIARDRGEPIGPDTPVVSLFPEYRPLANPDGRKDRITVEDLMNMAGGLAIDDGDPSSPGNEGTLQEQPGDWYRYTLDLPMVADPGGDRPVYGSANTNLVGGALRNATGRWLPELFDEYLARPLGITTYQMNLMPDGEAYAGGGLYLRPRDQLKLGRLYLDGGLWYGESVVNGERVVSTGWVERSLARRGDLKPRMDIDTAHGYGYAWHFRSCTVGGRTFPYYWAGGNGGQLVIVVPDLDLVVGFTGGDYTQYRKYLRWEVDLLPRYIIPAVLR